MDGLLDVGVNADHLVVELRVVAHQHLGVPSRCDEDSVNAARDGGREDVGNLQANEEGKCNNDGRVAASLIIRRVGEDQVEVSEEGTGVANEGGAEREDGADETFLDDGQLQGVATRG